MHPTQAQPMSLPVIPPHDQSLSPQLNPTTSLTSSCSNSPELFCPTPTSSTIQNKWPSPLVSLNDPHTLGKDITYTIMQALCQQIGATMTPQLHIISPVVKQLKTSGEPCALSRIVDTGIRLWDKPSLLKSLSSDTCNLNVLWLFPYVVLFEIHQNTQAHCMDTS